MGPSALRAAAEGCARGMTLQRPNEQNGDGKAKRTAKAKAQAKAEARTKERV
jgi:hypothetical protein